MKKEYDFRRGKRGAVVTPTAGKTRITIRLDEDILAWFRDQVHKSGGGNYQTRQPVRGGRRGRPHGGLPQGLGLRSRLGVWRDRGVERPRGRRAGA